MNPRWLLPGVVVLGLLPAWLGSVPGLSSDAFAANASPDTTHIPDPNTCTFPNRLGRSPRNTEVANPLYQYTYRGTLRNETAQPIPNWPASDIELEIASPCQNPIILNPDGPSDLNGQVVWGPDKIDQAGGGACTGQAVVKVRLRSIGIYKLLHAVTSPDQNGDGTIALPDLSNFQQAFVNGGPEFRGDLNLSGGLPDLADLNFFQRHFIATR